MGIKIETEKNSVVVKIDGPFAINEVGEIKTGLVEAISAKKDCAVDLTAVTDCDTAGIQLLVAAQKKSQELKQKMVIEKISEPVRLALDRLGLTREDLNQG
ncbi:MAG: STAS domain-containing protein [Proteobacteria bacterium]|nr:STAS domain-containing protein [Pseudomonadota bacterium]